MRCRVDETGVGGLEKNRHANKKKRNGTGLHSKTVVMGLVQQGGEIRAGMIDNVKRATLHAVIQNHVEAGSKVYTDEHPAYRGLSARYDHQTFNHGAGEYVSGNGASTNAVESLWALFKRQYHATHHYISPKHLDAYLNEMTFRLNRRDIDKGQRTTALLSQIEGPLPYKALIA